MYLKILIPDRDLFLLSSFINTHLLLEQLFIACVRVRLQELCIFLRSVNIVVSFVCFVCTQQCGVNLTLPSTCVPG